VSEGSLPVGRKLDCGRRPAPPRGSTANENKLRPARASLVRPDPQAHHVATLIPYAEEPILRIEDEPASGAVDAKAQIDILTNGAEQWIKAIEIVEHDRQLSPLIC